VTTDSRIHRKQKGQGMCRQLEDVATWGDGSALAKRHGSQLYHASFTHYVAKPVIRRANAFKQNSLPQMLRRDHT
jgi:hypothetical protein